MLGTGNEGLGTKKCMVLSRSAIRFEILVLSWKVNRLLVTSLVCRWLLLRLRFCLSSEFWGHLRVLKISCETFPGLGLVYLLRASGLSEN